MDDWYFDANSEGPDVVDSSDAEFDPPVKKVKVTIETNSKLFSPIKLPIMPMRMFSSSSRSVSPSEDLEETAVKAQIFRPIAITNGKGDYKHEDGLRHTDESKSRRGKRSRSRSRKSKRRSNSDRRRSHSRERKHRKRKKSSTRLSPKSRKRKKSKSPSQLLPKNIKRKISSTTVSKEPKYVIRRVRLLLWKKSIPITKDLYGHHVLCLRIMTKRQYEKLEAIFDHILNEDGIKFRAIALRNTYRQKIGQYYKILVRLEDFSNRKTFEKRFSYVDVTCELRKTELKKIHVIQKTVRITNNAAKKVPKMKTAKRARKMKHGPTEECCTSCGMSWRGIRRTCPRCGSSKIVDKRKMDSKTDVRQGQVNDSETVSSDSSATDDDISYF